ncbi:hypothetical protein DYI26_17645 [Halomonas litopenaei]|nr:hypothetical protein [Halomonas litopenaei]
MRKRSLRGVNEHFDPIFNAVLPSAGTFQTSPSERNRNPGPGNHDQRREVTSQTAKGGHNIATRRADLARRVGYRQEERSRSRQRPGCHPLTIG